MKTTTNILRLTLYMLLLCITGLQVTGQSGTPSAKTIDLSGQWTFQMDPLDKGVQEAWFNQSLSDNLKLPGSMLTNGKGNEVTEFTPWTGGRWDSIWYKQPSFARYRQPGQIKVSFWLQPKKFYTGAAWYQKKLTIPAGWNKGFTELFLERCHWETILWIDGQKIEMQNALGAPQRFDISQILTPGAHTITLRIDNRVKDINPGVDAHSITDNTQTNWNGVIGKMELINRPAVYISDVQLYPDTKNKLVKANLTIGNLSGSELDYTIRVSAKAAGKPSKKPPEPMTKTVKVKNGTTTLELTYPMGNDFLPWDEFNPDLYSFHTTLSGKEGTDTRETIFGMKNFGMDGTQFTVNGRKIFLRGTLECAIFPKTGYPSTDAKDWEKIYRQCKAFGLNHVRFHSWCPPEAAFTAADKMGIYLSVEASAWCHELGEGKPIDRYVYEESNRIVQEFGNHPSFCMLSYGNEASGKGVKEYLTAFVQYWQQKDTRRVYTSALGFPEVAASDFTSSPKPRIQHWAEGLKSILNAQAPSTNYDWTKSISTNKPTVSHEIGQWCVYPNFKEMAKYDGPLQPKNFEIFKDLLTEHGMLPLADSFLMASGKLQVLCYKADIEAALRTPGFAGFQLLDLHDFPGQGTALVGVLDPFWDEKPYVSAAEYKQFCNTTVPLLRMEKMIFTNDETFTAQAEIAHYGNRPLENITPAWSLSNKEGKILARGTFQKQNMATGLHGLGTISQKLSGITKPAELTVTLNAGTFVNSWHIWVYPSKQPEIKNASGIKIAQAFDEEARQYVENGGSLLLTIKKGSVKPEMGGKVPVGFSSIFWNTQWTAFKQAPFTLGILCNPAHPALAEFPTNYHSDYQWWDAMSHSQVFVLDSVAKNIQPIVRVIDDWFTAKPLGLIFECSMGKGKLLVSGIDLISDMDKRPEARQLLFSLKKYMASDAFNPQTKVEAKQVNNLFTP